MRDLKRIPRILRKVEKAWKKSPDTTLIQFLITLGKDEDRDLDPLFLEDRHLEEILDKKVPRTKLEIKTERLFEIAYRTSSGKAHVAADAFIRDARSSTLHELLGNPGITKMGVKDWYAVKLEEYRVVFRPVNRTTIELLDFMSEARIQAFHQQMDKEAKESKEAKEA